ncbi:MAG: PEP-CTERM sorting domain-containing protein [Verrucomicrobia bacterium]|nr:PEP-CTERM sorting domain-containing protein [Verrucomicrobiota bacterium]
MKLRNLLPLACGMAVVLGFSASAQLFRDQMKDGTGWGVNANSTDYLYTFNYDYSANGVPEAPNSLGGDDATRGVKLEANLTTGTGQFFTLYPLGQNFTGSYQLRFDAWMNYAGSATTEFMGGGIGYDNVTADVASGAQFIVTGDGGSASDWRALKDGFYVATGASYPAGSLNNTATYYADFLPSVNGSIAGAPGFQWITWEFNVAGNEVSIYIEKPNTDRLLLISYDKTTPNVATTDGNISLFYADFFTSLSDSPASQFGLVDNVIVTAIPEPTSVALVLLGGLGMFLMVRRRN